MPLYAGKYAICAFLQNMRNMLRAAIMRSHDRYKPVSLISSGNSTPSTSSSNSRAATNTLTKIRNIRDLRTCRNGPKSDQKWT